MRMTGSTSFLNIPSAVVAPRFRREYSNVPSPLDSLLRRGTSCLDFDLDQTDLRWQRGWLEPFAGTIGSRLVQRLEYIHSTRLGAPDTIANGNRSLARNLQLSLPRMNPNTGCKPNKLRKYHDKLDTHLTSRSRVITPDCSMDLNRIVRGNGSFTVSRVPLASNRAALCLNVRGPYI